MGCGCYGNILFIIFYYRLCVVLIFDDNFVWGKWIILVFWENKMSVVIVFDIKLNVFFLFDVGV